jgi:hypothetical protein
MLCCELHLGDIDAGNHVEICIQKVGMRTTLDFFVESLLRCSFRLPSACACCVHMRETRTVHVPLQRDRAQHAACRIARVQHSGSHHHFLPD